MRGTITILQLFIVHSLFFSILLISTTLGQSQSATLPDPDKKPFYSFGNEIGEDGGLGILKIVDPFYTSDRDITIKFEFEVKADGSVGQVENPRTLYSHLVGPGIMAIKKWKFTPHKYEEVIRTSVAIRFMANIQKDLKLISSRPEPIFSFGEGIGGATGRGIMSIPEFAVPTEEEGDLTFYFEVLPDGSVGRIKTPITEKRELAKAGLDAIKTWKFTSIPEAEILSTSVTIKFRNR